MKSFGVAVLAGLASALPQGKGGESSGTTANIETCPDGELLNQ